MNINLGAALGVIKLSYERFVGTGFYFGLLEIKKKINI